MPGITQLGPADGGPTFDGVPALFPFVFITIACGAISGFHALVASGTTPKMIDKERDCRAIGYGAMLMEGLVGITALIAACVPAARGLLRDQHRPEGRVVASAERTGQGSRARPRSSRGSTRRACSPPHDREAARPRRRAQPASSWRGPGRPASKAPRAALATARSPRSATTSTRASRAPPRSTRPTSPPRASR